MPSENIVDVVRRIPVFKDLAPPQLDNLLLVCTECTYQEGDVIFSEGESSETMLILLSGSFQVCTVTGSEIAVISEMGIVGEMGMLTEQTRSATVVARRATRALRISRQDLFHLMDADRDLGFKIYRNLTHLLCDRLRDNNIVLEQQYLLLEDLSGDHTQT